MTARIMVAILLVAASAHAEWIVSSYNNNRAYRFDTTNGALVGGLVTNNAASGLQLPHDILFDADENILIASANNDRILKFDGRSGAFLGQFVTNASGGLDYPVGMAYGPDGQLYVSSQSNDCVKRYDSVSGAYIDTFVPTNSSGGLDGPSDIVFGPDGNLYVAGRYTNRVYRYNGASGAFMDVFVTNVVSQPFGLLFGLDGNLLVGGGNNNTVLKYNGTNGQYLGVFLTNGPNLSLPVEMEYGPDGNLYVTSFGSNAVLRYNGTNGAFMDIFISGGAIGLSGPNFLQWRPDPDPAFETWKSNRFTVSQLTNSSFSSDHANPDGDAFDNRDEYIADTDPMDAASGFPAATNSSGAGVQSFTVSPTSTGRLYDVYWKTNLLQDATWAPVGLNRAGTGTNLALVVTNNLDANYYRTGVALP
jgi:WD40 repeat protein